MFAALLSVLLSALLPGGNPAKPPSVLPGETPLKVSPNPRPPAPLQRLFRTIRPAEQTPETITVPPDEKVPSKIFTSQDVKEESVDWGISGLNIPAAWKTTDGAGVTVAVLDTGADANHRDLKNQIIKSKDFTGSRFGTDDRVGHGTHCAGVVGAERNDWGMCGVAPKAKLLVGKVLNDAGNGGVDGIAKGIDWSVENGADVVSMSLGGPSPDNWIPPALARAEAAGVIVVAAAGNAGPRDNTVGYPGGYPTVVCVAATDANSAVAGFSSRGKAVFVAGPGVDVRSCYPGPGDGLFATMSGTSMATPHVAGLAALWVSAHPEVPKKDRPARFRAALQACCKDLPPNGRDSASGWGLPDAAKLVAGGGKTPDPVPTPTPADQFILTPPDNLPVMIGGRKVKRIIFELEPLPQPMPEKKP